MDVEWRSMTSVRLVWDDMLKTGGMETQFRPRLTLLIK